MQYVKYEVLAAVGFKCPIFWDIKQCCPVEMNRAMLCLLQSSGWSSAWFIIGP
jgi:hypothetical protein